MDRHIPFSMKTWTETVRLGDILIAPFPYPRTEDCSTRTPRPCVVLDVEDYLGARFIELIPGTRAPLPECDPTALFIDATSLFPKHQHLGSWCIQPHLADRFDARHPDIFDLHGPSPIIGWIYGSMLDAVDHLRGQRQAIRERLARDRRERRAIRRWGEARG